MSDWYVVDFLDVESNKGGDALTLQYTESGVTRIHVVDGGYQETGPKIVSHLRTHYNQPSVLDHVVLTHQDNDHAGGLRTVLESFEVRKLWMLRPWLYADELLPRFSRYRNVDNLKDRLREVYSNIDALEKLAEENGIPIGEPFAGARIGAFTVLSPTKEFYLDLVVNSDKTPDARVEDSSRPSAFAAFAGKVVNYFKRMWGVETFSTEGTTNENEMSVVQYARLCGNSVLLTGDAGREALTKAADYGKRIGLTLPGIDRFQVPHHGSRRNLSSKLLDTWLGPKLAAPIPAGQETTYAMISASSKDADHPRKVVVRSLIHRGRKVILTKGNNFFVGFNVPPRNGYGPVNGADYPDEEESE